MIDPLINSLTQVVVSLFDLSGDSRLTGGQQHQMFVSASQLHGVSVSLASQQFATNSAQYTNAIAGVQQVNASLTKASQAIGNVASTVANLAALASAVDALVKVALTLVK